MLCRAGAFHTGSDNVRDNTAHKLRSTFIYIISHVTYLENLKLLNRDTDCWTAAVAVRLLMLYFRYVETKS